MDSQIYSVSEVARVSGLPVSALRFYSGNGVLIPAFVDQRTGYRWYTDEQVKTAEVLSRLRSTGLSLAEIRQVISPENTAADTSRILDAHVSRLVSDFDAACEAVEDARTLLARRTEAAGKAMRFDVVCAELAHAFAAIRFAVSVDTARPALQHVLVEVQNCELTLVATDRHRLAVGRVAAHGGDGVSTRLLVPVRALEFSLQKLCGEHTTSVEVSDKRMRLSDSEVKLLQPTLAAEFPDFRSILPQEPRYRVHATRDRLRRELEAVLTRRVVRRHDGKVTHVCALDFRRGRLSAACPSAPGGLGGLRVGVDQAYMFQALDALNCAELAVAADGPASPIAIRPAENDRVGSLLMPVLI